MIYPRREEGVGLLNVPTVVGNVMLRWESIVLWWFYPRMGLGLSLIHISEPTRH